MNEHGGRIVSGREPDPTSPPGEGRKVYNWQCSCGAVGPGRFRSERAARDDHDDHMLAMVSADG